MKQAFFYIMHPHQVSTTELEPRTIFLEEMLQREKVIVRIQKEKVQSPIK